MEQDHKKSRTHAAMILSAAIILFIVLAACLFQAYVRWFINQNYTVLGGWELEALTVSGTILLIALGLKK